MREAAQRRTELIANLQATLQSERSKLAELRAARRQKRRELRAVAMAEFRGLWTEMGEDFARFRERVALVSEQGSQSSDRYLAELKEAVERGEERVRGECAALDVLPAALPQLPVGRGELDGRWEELRLMCGRLGPAFDRAQAAKSIDAELASEVAAALALAELLDAEMG
jgi:hypothetical protein